MTEPISNPPSGGPPKLILVVDDDEDVGAVLVRILNKHGFEAVAIHEPSAAVPKVVELEPDLVLLDYDMPKILGPELAMFINRHREADPVPILFVSGMADEDHQMIATASGGSGFVSKPVEEKKLIAAVNRVLDSRKPRGA